VIRHVVSLKGFLLNGACTLELAITLTVFERELCQSLNVLATDLLFLSKQYVKMTVVAHTMKFIPIKIP